MILVDQILLNTCWVDILDILEAKNEGHILQYQYGSIIVWKTKVRIDACIHAKAYMPKSITFSYR